MKPLNIVLLLLAGALGGAVVMRVTSHRPVAPAPVAAQAPAPVQTAAPAEPLKPEAKPAEAPPEPKPSPTVASQPPSPRRPASKSSTKRVAVAQVQSPVPAVTPPPPPPPVAEPVKETPAPPSIPPARSEPENVTPATPPPPEPHTVTLNAGTLIPVRLVDGLSSERNMSGDVFTATLDKELVVDGFVIAERGARVEGRVVVSDRGGKVRGVASLIVELTRLRTADGQNVAVQTESFERQASETHGQDAAKVGVGAAIGAAIGAIAGGGKGAAIGAGAGGAAGAGGVLLSRGQASTLPSETRITFRLRSAVTVTERVRG